MIGLLLAAALGAGPLDPDGARDAAPAARMAVEAPPPAVYPGEVDRPPVLQFRARLPGGRVGSGSHSERGRPVVYGDLVLVGSAAGDALYGLSRRDGGLVLSWPAGGAVQSAPIVLGERVVFSDTGGNTWCYRLDGELVWRHRGTAPVLSDPTLAGGLLYVADVQDLVVALQVDTGELEWRYRRAPDLTRDGSLALFAATPPAVEGDEVIVGFSDGAVVVLDAATGDERWSVRVGEGAYPDVVARVLPFESDLYASGYFSPFVAIDRTNQNVRWRLEYGAAAGAVLDLNADPPLLYHPGTDGVLRAVVARTGADAWSWSSGRSGALTQVISVPAGLLVASAEGSLYLVDPQTGAERWRHVGRSLLNGISTPPVVAGRQILAVTNAGYLMAWLTPRERERPDHRPWSGGATERRGGLDR